LIGDELAPKASGCRLTRAHLVLLIVRRCVSENGPVNVAENAFQFGLAAKHGASSFETAVHRQRRHVEPPTLETGKLGGIGFDLLLYEMQQAELVGVEAVPAQPGLKGSTARLSNG